MTTPMDKKSKTRKPERLRTGSAVNGGNAQSDGAEDDSASSSRSTLFGRILAVASIVAVLAAVVAVGVFGYRAYQVYAVEYPAQQARDESTSAAEQAILNVTTIDPRNLEQFKRNAEASLTGQAKEQVLGGSQGSVLGMLNGVPDTASLSSRLVRSAPAEVNADDGKAVILVYVLTTAKRAGQADVDQTRGFSVDMVRQDDSWKAESIKALEGIEYQDAAPGGQN